MSPLRFWRGQRLYQIAPARDGSGFIGLCDGRIVATAPDRPSVLRIILMTLAWHQTGDQRRKVPA